MSAAALDVVEGYAPYGEYRTWYRVTGNLKGGKPPLFILHGGPGCTHDYVDSFKLLATAERAVVHYDQIGNGRSTHLRDKGPEFWTVDLFKRELDTLIDHLGARERYSVLGQSWGGMLGAEFAVDRPAGLKALVIADSPASMSLWLAAAAELRAELPPKIQATLLAHEEAGTTDTKAYQDAVRVFNERHVCRLVPMPAEVARTFEAIEEDPTVYHSMNGPSEFHVIGTLKTWSIVGRLGTIDVPTLLISGKYDEAMPSTVQPFADEIPDVRWRIFDNSSHLPHVEETALCMQVVGDFLDSCDV